MAAAYAVSARSARSDRYRTTRRDRMTVPSPAGADGRAAPAARTSRPSSTATEPVGASWAEIVIGWTETTFYLFDPQSWR